MVTSMRRPVAAAIVPLMQRSNQCSRHGGGDQSIDAIEDASMTRDQAASVFRPVESFERRFEEVASLFNNRQ